jgi:hypothetical protein
LNRHQKAVFRPGEQRVRGEEIERLIELAYSEDPAERLDAAQNLCPCHVRKRVEAVWQALYRLMLDPDVRVRRAAWHTLEDGGCPNDPALMPIFGRAVANETDIQVRRWVERFAVPALAARDGRDLLRAVHSPFQERGRCDFCGETARRVRTEYRTELTGSGGAGSGRAPLGAGQRFARICQQCDVQTARPATGRALLRPSAAQHF